MASARKFTGRRGRGKKAAADPKEAPANLLSIEVTRLEGDRLRAAWSGRHVSADVVNAMKKVCERLTEQVKDWPRAQSLKLITTRDGFACVGHACCSIWEQRYAARGGRLTDDEREWLRPINHLAHVLAKFVTALDLKTTPRMERDSLPEDILSGVESSFSEPQTETAE